MAVTTREQKVASLREGGYNPIHLIGGFYLVRYWSVKSKKSPYSWRWKAYLPLYVICYFKKEKWVAWVNVSTEVVKPKGKMRTD